MSFISQSVCQTILHLSQIA
uniref:Uncharacterized protein n=1 Tax=Arundo donax TaxID=35708 RepID=A0A0A8ZD75_ARUDO